MAINFPTSLDSFTNPSASSPRNNPSLAGEISDKNDAIVAIETKVGIDSSADTTSLDYKLKNTASVDPGHKHTVNSISATGTPSVINFLRGDGTWSAGGRFGGDGSDGALNVTGGDVNIDLGGAALVIKNYTQINITGSYKLTFSNPHANGTKIVLKSKGNVTLTSSAAPMIDASGMGAAGGTHTSTDGNPGNAATASLGTVNFGTGGTSVGSPPSCGGGGGGASYAAGSDGVNASGGSGAKGTGGVAFAIAFDKTQIIDSFVKLIVGAGGGAGGTRDNTLVPGGDGGNGGGCLYIQCAGALNFTTASGISVNGKNGGNGTNYTDNGSGAGGGGGGGCCIILYNTLTAASGTITSAAGSGGTGGTGVTYNGGNGGNGGAGYSLIAKNTEFF